MAGRLTQHSIVLTATVVLVGCLCACGTPHTPLESRPATNRPSTLASELTSRLIKSGYSVASLPLIEHLDFKAPGGGFESVTRPLFIPGKPQPTEAFQVSPGATSEGTLRLFIFSSATDARAAANAGVTALPYGGEVCPASVCAGDHCPASTCHHKRLKPTKSPLPHLAYVRSAVLTGWAPRAVWEKFVAATGH